MSTYCNHNYCSPGYWREDRININILNCDLLAIKCHTLHLSQGTGINSDIYPDKQKSVLRVQCQSARLLCSITLIILDKQWHHQQSITKAQTNGSKVHMCLANSFSLESHIIQYVGTCSQWEIAYIRPGLPCITYLSTVHFPF